MQVAINGAATGLSGVWGGFVRPKPGSKPKNCPYGTIPIDQVGLDKDDVHSIKNGVGAGSRDLIRITPGGDAILAILMVMQLITDQPRAICLNYERL